MAIAETTTVTPQVPHWKQPSHPGLIEVLKTPSRGSFSSYGVVAKDFPQGALVAQITSATPAANKAYSSLQISEDQHIELNSDLLYCNHSCDPTVIFDVNPGKMEVRAAKDLKKGDSLTFFYPSTEWDMAQGFDCYCGSEQCLGRIDGARKLNSEVLARYWVSEHIKNLRSGSMENASDLA